MAKWKDDNDGNYSHDCTALKCEAYIWASNHAQQSEMASLHHNVVSLIIKQNFEDQVYFDNEAPLCSSTNKQEYPN